jgi:hypothetical protein
MLKLTTNGRTLRDGLETMGSDRFQVSREGLQSLGREGLHAGREGLQAGREGLQSLGSSMADLAETLPIRQKRRRSFPLLGAIAVAIAGVAIIALIAGLQSRREGLGPLKLRSKAQQARLPDDAVGRAADEGVGNAVGASAADDLVGRSGGRVTQSEFSVVSPTAGGS